MIYLTERQEYLTVLIEEYHQASYPHRPDSYSLWQRFVEHKVLPFGGGWLDQPQWWLEDVDYFEALEELAGVTLRLQKVGAGNE